MYHIVVSVAKWKVFDICMLLLSAKKKIWRDFDFSLQGFPVLYILCERRTAAMYDAIWDRICILAPGVQNIRSALCDYESAAISSLRRKFPNISIRGCWFHYCRVGNLLKSNFCISFPQGVYTRHLLFVSSYREANNKCPSTRKQTISDEFFCTSFLENLFAMSLSVFIFWLWAI